MGMHLVQRLPMTPLFAAWGVAVLFQGRGGRQVFNDATKPRRRLTLTCRVQHSSFAKMLSRAGGEGRMLSPD